MDQQGKHHFSHKHMLIPIELDEGEQFVECKACQVPVDGTVYGCPTCQYFLDEHCFDAPRSMDHPSHPAHPLSLTPIPTYPSRAYICNACGHDGKSFSFSCAKCEFDLHLLCANLPETFLFEDEHPHELQLVFERAPSSIKDDDQVVTVSCSICNEDQISWWYRCGECEYVVHMRCLFSKYESEETADHELSSKVVSVEGAESSSSGVREKDLSVGVGEEEDGHDNDEIGETLSQMPMLAYAIRAYAELLLEDSSDDDDDNDEEDDDA